MPFFAVLGGLAVGLAVWAGKITLPAEIMSGLQALAEKIPLPPAINEFTRWKLINAESAGIAGFIAFVIFLILLELLRFRILVRVGRFRQGLAEKTLQKSTDSSEYSGTTEVLKKLYK